MSPEKSQLSSDNRPAIADGSLEAMKWIALLLMLLDHINKYLFNGALVGFYEAGRLAMPLFVFVLAYNLARPNVTSSGAYIRTMKRLVVFGLLATPVFIALGGVVNGWWPLNILFTLFIITAVAYLIELDTITSYAAAALIYLTGCFFVEYWWPALTLGIAIWWHYKHSSWIALAIALTALVSLWFVNSNAWALGALVIVFIASRVDLSVPRLRWAFYIFYPLHLFVLWLIRIPMSKAGYLFFD